MYQRAARVSRTPKIMEPRYPAAITFGSLPANITRDEQPENAPKNKDCRIARNMRRRLIFANLRSLAFLKSLKGTIVGEVSTGHPPFTLGSLCFQKIPQRIC
jgi:hypothetical protein